MAQCRRTGSNMNWSLNFHCCGPYKPKGRVSMSTCAISISPTPKARRCRPGLKVGLWGILVHCSLLSTSHFVSQTSPAWPPRSTTTLTRSQLVNVSGCMQACWKGWGEQRDRHMKGLHVVKMVVEDGPLKHCSHYALPREKRQSSGNETSPLDLLSCDIFVFQACDPAHR